MSQQQVLQSNPAALQFRQVSYTSSPFVEDIDKSTLPEVEIVKNPPEWKYVERLLSNAATVPVPTPKTEYPSGWKPQTIDPNKAEYMIHRNKNHMVPIYLKIQHRGYRRITIIKNIQGNIWILAEELRNFLEDYTGRKILIRVQEFSGQIWIRKDYVNLVKDYLMEKGY